MFVISSMGGCLASLAGMCACQCFTCASREVLRKSARMAYCFLFTLALVLSWVLRDFAKPIIEKIPWILPGSGYEPSDRWYGQQAVFRLSMGNWLFFSFMALVLLGVKYKSDKRDQYLHHGNWMVKLGLWLLFSALPFFFPNGLINMYGFVARFGGGAFLVVQMIILLDFTQTWNDTWVAMEDERYLYALLGVTVGCYAGIGAVVGLLFYWFNPAAAGDCSFNVTVIVLSLVVALVLGASSMHPAATNGSLFPAAVVSLYCTYLAYSALQSEPHDYKCNSLGKQLSAASGSTLALGMAVALASVVWSALRVGSNTEAFLSGSSTDGAAGQPLLERRDEEEGTSAGLDGEAPRQQGPMTAGGQHPHHFLNLTVARRSASSFDLFHQHDCSLSGILSRATACCTCCTSIPQPNLKLPPVMCACRPQQGRSDAGLRARQLQLQLVPLHLQPRKHVHRDAHDRVGHGCRGEGSAGCRLVQRVGQVGLDGCYSSLVPLGPGCPGHLPGKELFVKWTTIPRDKVQHISFVLSKVF